MNIVKKKSCAMLIASKVFIRHLMQKPGYRAISEKFLNYLESGIFQVLLRKPKTISVVQWTVSLTDN